VVEAGWRCPWESYIPSNHFSVPWFWLAECVRKRAHIPLTIFFFGPNAFDFPFHDRLESNMGLEAIKTEF